jgi:hypothetical protein
MLNHWLILANAVLENEILLLKDNLITRSWYMKMPTTIPAICPDVEVLSEKNHFAPQVGIVHHMRLTRLGIEAILKAPRKYHRMQHDVFYDTRFTEGMPFWMVLRKNYAKF